MREIVHQFILPNCGETEFDLLHAVDILNFDGDFVFAWIWGSLLGADQAIPVVYLLCGILCIQPTLRDEINCIGGG